MRPAPPRGPARRPPPPGAHDAAPDHEPGPGADPEASTAVLLGDGSVLRGEAARELTRSLGINPAPGRETAPPADATPDGGEPLPAGLVPLAVGSCGDEGCDPTGRIFLQPGCQREPHELRPVLTLEPPVPGLVVGRTMKRVGGDGPPEEVWLEGRFRGRTTYRVRLPRALCEGPGATGTREASFVTGEMPGILFVGKGPVVLPPKQPFQARVAGVAGLRVRAHSFPVDGELDTALGAWFGHEEPALDGAWLERSIDVPDGLDRQVDVTLPIDEALAATGHALLEVRPAGLDDVVRRVWIQRTRIGLSMFPETTHLLVWAHDVVAGKPLAGVAIGFHGQPPVARTDRDGLARVPYPAGPLDRHPLLDARLGGEVALAQAPLWPAPADGAWTPVADFPVWYLATVRRRVAGGERLVGFGILREVAVATGDVRLPAKRLPSVELLLASKEYRPIAPLGAVTLADDGTFSFDVPMPAELPEEARVRFTAGEWNINLRLEETGGEAAPHPAASLDGDGDSPLAPGRPVTLAYRAAPGEHPLAWELSQQDHFDRAGFRFGVLDPPYLHETFDGQTAPDGTARLVLAPRDAARPLEGPVRLELEAGGPGGSASRSFVAHPAALAVGLRAERPWVPAGTKVAVLARLFDADLVPSVAGGTVRREARAEGGTVVARCDVAARPQGRCELALPAPGKYVVRGTARDGAGRTSASELEVEALPRSGDPIPWDDAGVETPDDAQSPGAARLLVRSPFAPAEGLLVLQRQAGPARTVRFRMDTAAKVIEVPLREGDEPGVAMSVTLLSPAGAAPTARFDRWSPAYVFVNERPRRLDVALSTPVAPRPGTPADVTVRVADAAGKPVAGATVAVAVADEATGEEWGDPFPYLHRKWRGLPDEHDTRFLLAGNPEGDSQCMCHEGRAYSHLLDLGPRPPGPAAPRGGGLATARTDARGVATIRLDLPPAPGVYRLQAVAVHGAHRFGLGRIWLVLGDAP